MAQEAGFRIGEEFYPFPDNYRIGDSVLIEMLTGLDMEDFAEALAESESSARVFAGLIGVAVWRQHPRWDLNKVARFVRDLDLSSIGAEGGGEEEEEDPPSPPQTGGGESDESVSGSSEPAAASTSQPAWSSEL